MTLDCCWRGGLFRGLEGVVSLPLPEADLPLTLHRYHCHDRDRCHRSRPPPPARPMGRRNLSDVVNRQRHRPRHWRRLRPSPMALDLLDQLTLHRRRRRNGPSLPASERYSSKHSCETAPYRLDRQRRLRGQHDELPHPADLGRRYVFVVIMADACASSRRRPWTDRLLSLRGVPSTRATASAFGLWQSHR